MSAGYTIDTTGDVALVAATAKTILNIVTAANAPIRLVEAAVSFDGITANAVPVMIELCKSTQAGAGTSTSQTPNQIRGLTRTVQSSGARNYSAEPTVLTAIKRWKVHPQSGAMFQLPLGREVEQGGTAAAGLAIRCTAAANVNVQAYMEFEEG